MDQKAKQYLTARKKYHVIYKTTCLITNKYYIGMHSTDDLADGYLGSGKRLWYSLNKHGKENHDYEIIEHLPDRASLRVREAELIDKILLEDDLCMNIALGGHGSWDHVNSSGANLYEKRGNLKVLTALKKASIESARKRREDPEHALKYNLGISKAIKLRYQNGLINHFTGKSHTLEARDKMKTKFVENVHQQGEKNSMYGTMWVSNLKLMMSKRIAKGAELEEGWIIGRKIWLKI